MSCYEWESGEIILPRAEYAKFKKRIRDAHNKEQQLAYEEALKTWGAMRFARNFRGSWDDLWISAVSDLDDDTRDKICWSLYRGNPRNGEPAKPRIKDFPKANVRTKGFDASSEAMISFEDKIRTVRWSVSENNHACEHARRSVLARVFFEALHAVNWTRGSGGKIVGNDEYNRDSDYEGGGANYVKGEWGPNIRRGLLR